MPETLATSDLHFTITRVYDAPRSLVWRMWTDPDEIAGWWHPHGLVTPRDSVAADVRAGGAYRYTMVEPDGTEYPTGGVYLEVVEPERLVFTWGHPDASEPQPVAFVELSEHGADGGATHLTFTLRGVEGRPGDEYFHDGWAEALEELASLLDSREH